MNPKGIAAKENVQRIFDEVAPSGSLDFETFANVVSGKRNFPDPKEDVLDAFTKIGDSGVFATLLLLLLLLLLPCCAAHNLRPGGGRGSGVHGSSSRSSRSVFTSRLTRASVCILADGCSRDGDDRRVEAAGGAHNLWHAAEL
jgi:hypothetical protein